jgi:small subunit ribosomal protein S6
MNNYELILILNPDLSSKFDDFQTKFEKTLKDIKFKISKLENIGRRQLAYSILNHNKGHYVIFQIEGPSEAALELESKLKYDTSVIRHLLLKVDTPCLEDSLLLIESREAKKAPQEEDQKKDKQESTQVETSGDTSNESPAKEESKDGE